MTPREKFCFCFGSPLYIRGVSLVSIYKRHFILYLEKAHASSSIEKRGELKPDYETAKPAYSNIAILPGCQIARLPHCHTATLLSIEKESASSL